MLPLQQQIKGMSYSGSLNKMQLLLELNPIYVFSIVTKTAYWEMLGN